MCRASELEGGKEEWKMGREEVGEREGSLDGLSKPVRELGIL